MITEKQSNYLSEYRQLRRELHKCFECGSVDDRTKSGKTRCAACAEKDRLRYQSKKEFYRLRSKENYYYYKSRHLCTKCGKQDSRTLSGKICCKECNDYDNKRRRERLISKILDSLS